MEQYASYFLMREADLPAYVRAKLPLFADCDHLCAKEIGDGNLNYVFRVWDTETGKSVIVKQASHTLRISDEMHLSLDRNRRECDILRLEGGYAPGLVPEIYYYDEIMHAYCMEDLSDHAIMRTALLQHEIFPDFAEQITDFMVNTLLPTTDVVMDHKEKKELQKRYSNPELCEITEDLVYTEPYRDLRGRNHVFPPNADFVAREIYGDTQLHCEAAQLKFDFMNNGQALLHGDLHTGSIFIRKDSMKVIDPEFTFYGPMGYDIGNVIANLIFAWCNGQCTMEAGAEKAAYLHWLETTIVQVVDLTRSKMAAAFDKLATDPMARAPGFQARYLASVMADTAGATGTELIRRTVGMANVKDITTIPDTEARAGAERCCLLAAKAYIFRRREALSGAAYLDILHDAWKRGTSK